MSKIYEEEENYTSTLVSKGETYEDVWYDRYGATYDGTNEYSQIIISPPDSSIFNPAKEYYGKIYTDENGENEATDYKNGTTYYVKITDNLNDVAGCGLTYEKYNNLKENMLSSIYKNGGFWIGQYEAGVNVQRMNSNDDLTIPIIKQNMYPYTYIRCSDAQIKISEIEVGNDCTCSLLFGIQWDLVLKRLEKHDVDSKELINDSSNWGNYSNVSFNVERGEYLIEGETKFVPVQDGGYLKPESSVLLTTGAADRNSKMNIYDLAGNVYEWTLEHDASFSGPCVVRGGLASSPGSSFPASNRNSRSATTTYGSYGFRVALY